MTAFTERLYVEWLGRHRRDDAPDRRLWLSDALEVGRRWRSARQRHGIEATSEAQCRPGALPDQPCGSAHARHEVAARGASAMRG